MPMKLHVVLRSLVLTCAAALLPALLAAQGSIAGTVSDSSGAPLGSARVSAAGVSATTADNGRYSLRVPAGVYDVRAQRIGHRAATVSRVVVNEGQEARVDFTLAGFAIELAPQVVSASRRPER